MRLLIFLGVIVLCANFVQGADPADSWLAYTRAKHADLVTYVNATWTVPANPKTDGATPAFWWGIEPEPALDLIQPILKWQAYGYYIFNEYYQWDNNYDFQSDSHQVEPGDKIFASVTYTKNNNSYTMFITSLTDHWSIYTSIPVEKGKIYTDVYFVIEHQPDYCSQYPSNGEITFESINIEIEGKPVVPKWTAHTYNVDCDCQPHVLSSRSVKFTWTP